MRLYSSNGKKSVDIGSEEDWLSIYSTAVESFGIGKRKIAKALKFMENGQCSGEDGYEVAKQFNLIRDAFAKIPPDKAIADIRDKKKKISWIDDLSPVVTSCANMYTTPDGKDLLFEIVSVLCYGQISKSDIIVE